GPLLGRSVCGRAPDARRGGAGAERPEPSGAGRVGLRRPRPAQPARDDHKGVRQLSALRSQLSVEVGLALTESGARSAESGSIATMACHDSRIRKLVGKDRNGELRLTMTRRSLLGRSAAGIGSLA